MPNPRCFIDFTVESVLIGRVIFELFPDMVPRTVENFRSLCTGSAGVNTKGESLYYKGSPVHRIVAGFMIQAGDHTLRTGKGSESIYGGVFEDEMLGDIDQEGLLVMANKGKNTNGSQFFVSLRPCPHLLNKHVVFGKVVKGYEIIEQISKLDVDAKDHPIQQVLISNCGELELQVRKVPVKKARSITPLSDRSRSRSRSLTPISRSVSPEPTSTKKSSSKKHKSSHSHRERDENGKKIKRDKSSSSKSKSKSSSRSKRDKSPDSEEERINSKAAQELAEIEALNKVKELEIIRIRNEELELERLDREKRLIEVKKRYESNGNESGAIYKGRGSMKAPESNGRSGGMRGW